MVGCGCEDSVVLKMFSTCTNELQAMISVLDMSEVESMLGS